ncbi:type II toxin-antitoxin system RelE/ParE family toxin [Asticcacaulis sp. BYS171W]|uniref:Toxin n=1 Tax=Asticcacaulis aquaticus TaxID=2984212 RepID=A0ABT5HXS3_9CAUL|nr:type II toxin-antitoxin system RelE/ParE family toxin [Asticcacaulis aquaticus]MDC7684742.1 type II toxin-antitoxin system RelE/ParE family toxin [Asticcacaulis aquaticus]
MSGFRLTARAKTDLRHISRYTEIQWGKSQRNIYLAALDTRFRWLAENPDHGRPREDIASGYRSFRHQNHIIFYMVQEDLITIIGIPHARMDAAEYFS